MDDQTINLIMRMTKNLLRTLEDITPHLASNAVVYSEGTEWTPRGILGHFADADKRALRALRGEDVKADLYHTFGDYSAEALVRMMIESRGELISDLVMFPRDATILHPWFGEVTPATLIKLTDYHTMFHVNDLHRALTRQGFGKLAGHHDHVHED